MMMATQTDRAHQRLTDMFAAHDLDQRYHALSGAVALTGRDRSMLPLARA